MTDLTPESRALLKGTREDFEASGDERDRVGRAIAARLGLAAGTIAATTTATSASAAGAAGAAAGASVVPGVGAGAAASILVTGTKWIGVVLLAGAVGAGGVSVYRMERTTTTSAPAVTSPPAQVTSPPAQVTSPQAQVAPPRRPGLAPIAPAPGRPIAPEVPPGAAVTPRTGSDPAPEGSRPRTVFREAPSTGTVAQETRLLRLADQAMRSGDPRRALDLLDEHARTFPNGILAEERSVERVSALCTLGRVAEAREEATRFLRATPDSPLAESVRSSCGAPER
jgi:hypothetical protein